VDARSEILKLKTAINTMVDTMSSFSSEVTPVAREVGSEGQLGGQARVEGVYGTWKRLPTNVNELASNLTTQVRAIAEVASAVAQGDMSRSITVEARGEVAELKDNFNLMVANLREATRAKDWLESNLARLAALMQGHRDLMEVADLLLRERTPLVNAQYGTFFLADPDEESAGLRAAVPAKGLASIAGYGSAQGTTIETGGLPVHGLVRQAAREKKRILVLEAPPDYIKINSGLGEAAPTSVVIISILFEDKAPRRHLLGHERPSLPARSFTPCRAPDCPLRQDGHGSHLPLRSGRLRDGHGDKCPHRACAVAHVDPGDDIGRPSEAAPTAAEMIPGGPVGPLGVPAARTALRGMTRIHLHKRHPGLACFVGQVLSELVEGPGGQGAPLVAA
jgi:HAMP domain-containing protein